MNYYASKRIFPKVRGENPYSGEFSVESVESVESLEFFLRFTTKASLRRGVGADPRVCPLRKRLLFRDATKANKHERRVFLGLMQ